MVFFTNFIGGVILNLKKKVNRLVCSTLLMSSFMFASADPSSAAEPSVSVKLKNYIGNKTAVTINATGQYNFKSENSMRLDGANRFVVASKIASSTWGESAETVILANYDAFADALAAAPLAYKYKGPILLTQKDFLTAQTKQDIQALNPKEVIIVGGTGSVSAEVSRSIKEINENISVRRIGGANRFEVAQKISTELGTPGTSIVADGMNFPDALAIAPYAARKGYPILLTQPKKLPTNTEAALKANKTIKTIVVGGEASVGPGVYSKLPGADRIGGANRFEVAANVLKELKMPANRAFIATGLTFADALTGSVYAAKMNAPLLLTMPTSIPGPTMNIIDTKAISDFTVLGGTGSVSDQVMENLPAKLHSNEDYSIKKEGSNLVLFKGLTKVKDFNSSSFTLSPQKYGTSNVIKVNGLSYLGNMNFNIEGGFIRPTNIDIPLEDYLKGVLPFEMSPSWENEALKAQAVAARTFVLRKGGKLIDDTESNQVYKGYIWYDSTNKAVSETTGLALTHSSDPINSDYNLRFAQAFYYSANGGKKLTNKNSWGSSRLPYSVLENDPYDLRSESSLKDWSFNISKNQIDVNKINYKSLNDWWSSAREKDSALMDNFENYLKSDAVKLLNKTSDIKFTKVKRVEFTTSFHQDQLIEGEIELEYFEKNANSFIMSNAELKPKSVIIKTRSYNVRSLIGTRTMYSPYIKEVKESADKFTVFGGGFGHGIGLSQYGAKQMAKEGMGVRNILDFYYPGTSLTKAY